MEKPKARTHSRRDGKTEQRDLKNGIIVGNLGFRIGSPKWASFLGPLGTEV